MTTWYRPPSLLDLTFYEHSQEAKLLRKTVKEYSKRYVEPVAAKLDKMEHREVIPYTVELVRRAAEIRLLSLTVPEEVGGMGGLSYMAANALEVLAYYDPGIATTIGAIWLGLLPIYVAGLMSQGEAWRKWMKPFVEAEERGDPQIWGFAITEPTAGSDYERLEPGLDQSKLRLITVAKPTGDGGYRVTGRKIFISNAPIATHITVFAVTDPSKPLDTMMCFVATRDMFRVEQVFDKMGHRSSPTGEIVFDDVEVPPENIVCKPGTGWHVVEISLAYSRAPVGAIGLGIAKKAFDTAVAYVLEREQAGRKLIDHQLTRYKLALMLERVVSAEALIYTATKRIDSSFPPPITLSSLAKAYGADVAVANSLDAIQLLGGYGYMRETGVEKLLRDAKLVQIYEGTNEINRLTAVEKILQAST